MKCSCCKKLLEEPIVLPCGHTICKIHETLRINLHQTNIKCPECHVEHELPKKGFPINSLAEKLLEKKFNEIDLGPEYKVAVDSFEELKRIVEKLKRVQDDPELEIDRVIDDLKNKIDLRREEEKKRIDEEALDLINELDKYQKTSKAAVKRDKVTVSNECLDLMQSLEKNDLVKWEDELSLFDRNLKRWTSIHKETVDKYKQLREESDRIKRIFFSDEFSKLEQRQKKFCGENTELIV